MIQVGQSYFTLTVAGGLEWAHFTNLVSGQVRKVIKQQPKTPRENSQLLNYQNRYIFCIGGKRDNGNASTVVEKYDIANDTWSLAPAINQKRIIHSGCTLGHNLYIYGGCNIKNNGP